MNAVFEILHRDKLPLGGFAGLKEHRLVTDSRLWGPRKKPATWEGLGNFVYLADARFLPHGETGMHPHQQIDVISVMVEGRITHAGSLGDGGEIAAPAVQVQTAGSQGFTHNETNPDNTQNRMIQLWALPEQSHKPAAYKVYQPLPGQLTRIYGGTTNQTETFPNQTLIDIARLDPEQHFKTTGPTMAYVTQGQGTANREPIVDGDLIRSHNLHFVAKTPTQLIVVRQLDDSLSSQPQTS